MRIVVCLAVVGLSGATLTSRQVSAQPAPGVEGDASTAKEYVDRGIAAQSAGDYGAAITYYETAYQLIPHPVLLFNMAQAHRLAGHADQALALYERYLVAAPDGEQAPIAREMVSQLKQQRVHADGAALKQPAATTAASRPGASGADANPAGPATPSSVRGAEPVQVHAHVQDKPGGFGWGYALGGSAVVTTVAGFFTLYQWRQETNEAKQIAGAATTDDCYSGTPVGLSSESRKHFDSACSHHKLQIVGLIVTGVGAVAAIGSLILMLRQPSSEAAQPVAHRSLRSRIAVAPIIAPTAVGTSLSLAW